MKVYLTATVRPQVSDGSVVADPRERLKHYVNSTNVWGAVAEARSFDVVVAENSGFDLSEWSTSSVACPRVTYVSVPEPPIEVWRRGKGAAEADLLLAALSAVPPTLDEMVFKCTGRLSVQNFGMITACLPTSGIIVDYPRAKSYGIDSRLFGGSFRQLRSVLGDIRHEANDDLGLTMESLLARILLHERPLFPVWSFWFAPRFVGVSGRTGVSYEAGKGGPCRAAMSVARRSGVNIRSWWQWSDVS